MYVEGAYVPIDMYCTRHRRTVKTQGCPEANMPVMSQTPRAGRVVDADVDTNISHE